MARRLLGPFIIGVAFVLGLIWSWGTWPDVLVDFGRELYVPWRLTEGEVLYRDIAWFYGPLSPYIHSLWFYCFGVSLRSLVILNAFVIAGVLCLLYWMFLRIAGRMSATLSCLTFLGVFAFMRITFFGNYNWVCPYTHSITYGTALSLLSFYLLFHFARNLRFVWVGSSGLVIGFVFLTKPEIFLAALTGNIAGILTILWLKRSGWRFLLLTFLAWIGLAIIPVGTAYILFSLELSLTDALYATTGSWPYVLNPGNSELLFYKTTIGTFDLMENIIIIAKCIGWHLLIFVPAAGLSFTYKRLKVTPMRKSAITFFLVGCVLLLGWQWTIFKWYYAPRPWPVYTLLLVLITSLPIIHRRYNYREHPVVVLRFVMVVFSFVLLVRVALFVRIEHYGFVLALPATLMVIASLWDWLPQLLKKYGGQPAVFRGAVLAAWLVTIGEYITISNYNFSDKQYRVGEGADSFKSDRRAIFVNKAMQIMTERAKADDTLAVLPEGIMLNYQLRMKTPTPYIEYLYPSFMFFGEDKILKSFQKNPPDWIMLISREESEYGYRFFGKDYGKLLRDWIDKNYVYTERIGDMPFIGERPSSSDYFGILIGEKKD